MLILAGGFGWRFGLASVLQVMLWAGFWAWGNSRVID
jgi:hypothetical protein